MLLDSLAKQIFSVGHYCAACQVKLFTVCNLLYFAKQADISRAYLSIIYQICHAS